MFCFLYILCFVLKSLSYYHDHVFMFLIANVKRKKQVFGIKIMIMIMRRIKIRIMIRIMIRIKMKIMIRIGTRIRISKRTRIKIKRNKIKTKIKGGIEEIMIRRRINDIAEMIKISEKRIDVNVKSQKKEEEKKIRTRKRKKIRKKTKIRKKIKKN